MFATVRQASLSSKRPPQIGTNGQRIRQQITQAYYLESGIGLGRGSYISKGIDIDIWLDAGIFLDIVIGLDRGIPRFR